MGDDGYVRVAGRPTDERRRRRQGAVLLLVLAALLLVAFVVALAVSQGWLGGSSAPNPRAACTPAAPLPTPSSITVHVDNGTTRPGLAARVARTLSAQGFRIASVRNDPLGTRPRNDGLIRFGPSGTAQAQVLQARFPGAVLERDGRTDAGVDVVLGSTFDRVVTPTAEPTVAATC